MTLSLELELPLADSPAGALASQRIQHLEGLAGLERGELVRLARAFPSLASVYSASEEQLARVVGPVSAARIRWFLDAPLDTRLATEQPRGQQHATSRDRLTGVSGDQRVLTPLRSAA